MRSRTAFWTTRDLQRFVGLFALGLAAWLCLPILPTDVQRQFAEWLPRLCAQWLPPVPGLRYLLLCLLALSLLGLLWAAYRIRAAHAKALEGAGDFRKGYDDDLKAQFQAMAVPVRRWLKWNTAVAAVTIWTFALWWALQRWPNELQHAVWAWLRPWL